MSDQQEMERYYEEQRAQAEQDAVQQAMDEANAPMSHPEPAQEGRQMKLWSCKIGEVDKARLPRGADGPMREAVEKAYLELTGQRPQFNFTGWGDELTEEERAVVENRLPDPNVTRQALQRQLAILPPSHPEPSPLTAEAKQMVIDKLIELRDHVPVYYTPDKTITTAIDLVEALPVVANPEPSPLTAEAREVVIAALKNERLDSYGEPHRCEGDEAYDRAVDDCIEAIEALPVVAPPARLRGQMAWQPMETAPKDKAVLVYDAKNTFSYTLAHYNTYCRYWQANWDGRTIQPTHWQPLPASPRSAETGATRPASPEGEET